MKLVLAIALLAGGLHVSSHALGAEPWVWQPEPGEIELFVGNIKNGKSAAARVRTAKVRRLFAWDPQNDEPDLGSGRLTVNQVEELLERRPELLASGSLRLAVRPLAWSGEDGRKEFDRFARLAWRIGHVHVKVDESGRLVRNGFYPDGLDKLIAEGRHRDLSISIIGQRFAMVPIIARDNATRLIVFRHGYDDSDEVAKRLSSARVQITAEQVSELPRFHFIEWTPTEGARMRGPLGPERSRT